jgi:hypothetical protein
MDDYTQAPKLAWVRLDSEFVGGAPTNAFYGARLAHGWLIWNHLNQTMAFVADPPEQAAAPASYRVRR